MDQEREIFEAKRVHELLKSTNDMLVKEILSKNDDESTFDNHFAEREQFSSEKRQRISALELKLVEAFLELKRAKQEM